MSSVVPVYPNSLLQWVDRIDEVSTDFANDINTVASDLISVENTIGVTPQTEKNPPNTNGDTTYPSVDARISDAMSGALLPVAIIRARNMYIDNIHTHLQVQFQGDYDPYGMFNGTDLTINTEGWYIFTGHANFSWWNNGYNHAMLCVDGSANILDQDVLNWEFSGNLGKNARWQKRTRLVHVTWQGHLIPGNRISLYVENGTTNENQSLPYAVLKMSMLKVLPTGVVT